jgi:hypothetical protein
MGLLFEFLGQRQNPINSRLIANVSGQLPVPRGLLFELFWALFHDKYSPSLIRR